MKYQALTISTLTKKFITCIVTGLTISDLLLFLGNGGNIPWLPPKYVFSLLGTVLLFSLIFPIIWHHKEKKDQMLFPKAFSILFTVIRYCIAFTIAGFGWKKFFGLQFNIPQEIASLPMNQQSGEWLTWYYFGYSTAFGIIIALLQIAGASLLLFSRTTLLGAMMLFTVMLNLLLINIFYDMNAGALIQSVILTVGLCFLIFSDYYRLVDFFLYSKKGLPSLILKNHNLKNILRILLLLLSFLFTAYLKSLVSQ